MRVRRVYEPASEEDGSRILVDRLWPRGLARDAARLDEWLADVAPSASLRRWYGHDPRRFAEFRDRYRAELDEPERADALDRLRAADDDGELTLLTATRDVDHSHAVVLAEALDG